MSIYRLISSNAIYFVFLFLALLFSLMYPIKRNKKLMVKGILIPLFLVLLMLLKDEIPFSNSVTETVFIIAKQLIPGMVLIFVRCFIAAFLGF